MEQKELEKLYAVQLEPVLLLLEKKRIRIQYLYYFAFLFALGVLFIIAYKLLPVVPALFLLIFVEAFTIIFININYSSYHAAYKSEVVAKIVKLVNSSYTFDNNKYITLENFNQSRIFPHKAAYVIGDDHIEGRIDKTVFTFSELRAWSRTREKKRTNIFAIIVSYLFNLRRLQFFDHYRYNNGLLFKGLFFSADFNKNLSESTFVLPDLAEKLFGKSGQALQWSKHHGQLVKLENQDFEKQFVVYSSSQQEARYVLTPLMMEAILNIKNKYRKKMYFSFTQSRVNMAIRYKKGLFEPRIHTSGVKRTDMEQILDLLNLIETIIREMDLNTRIWTKE